MNGFKEESGLMRACRALGFEALSWSLRRLHVPIGPDALVLEVGSGGNPYPRANVLLDAYEETRERHWAPLIADRPLALGFVERLPFKDKVFDFVIASHVLEHSPDPAAFLGEVERVGKAGYIETPDAFMERLNPYHDHRLEVTERGGELVIRKKTSWTQDPTVVDYYEDRMKPLFTGRFMRGHPFHFHLRHYWRDRIKFRIVNPGDDAGWRPSSVQTPPAPPVPSWREGAKGFFRRVLSQKRRNNALVLDSLLACPACRGPLARAAAAFRCAPCGRQYPLKNGVPVFTL